MSNHWSVRDGSRGGRRVGRALVGVFAAVALLSGCSSKPASAAGPAVASLQLPVFEKSCAQPPGSPTVVPIRVVGTSIVANVCIGRKGPFPFLVDTGAAASVVDSALAAKLHLHLVDGPRNVVSFTCKRQVSFTALSRWSVGDSTLPSETVQVGTIRSPALPNLDGVIGSDILSSFGAVRIDYRQQTLTLGPQGTPPHSDVAGSSGPPSVASTLVEGTSFAAVMPVTVVYQPLSPEHLHLLEVRPTVQLSIGSNLFTLTVDTGSGSAIGLGSSAVATLGLTPVGRPGATFAGLNCPIKVNHYALGPATLGTIPLPAQTVISNVFPSGTVGVIGSGTLIRYSPVVVDYTDGELLVGRGSQFPSAAPEPVTSIG
jgi:hypothetical protein